MPTTDRLLLPYPTHLDAADVPVDLQALADQVNGQVAGFLSGTANARPPAAAARRRYLYWAENTAELSVCVLVSGTWQWVLVPKPDHTHPHSHELETHSHPIGEVTDLSVALGNLMPKTGGTFTGAVTMNGRELRQALLPGAREASSSQTTSPVTLDCAAAASATNNYVRIVRSAATTIALDNLPSGSDVRATTFILYFTAAPVVTWSGSAWRFENGEPPSWDGSALVSVTVLRGIAVVGQPLEFTT